MRSASIIVGLVTFVLAGCSGTSTDDESSGASDDALSAQSCADADTAVFFHGMGGAGRELTTDGLCLPRMTDAQFQSSIALIDAPSATTMAGYSAGRLSLLKRMGSGNGNETTAIMLDPSWPDGARFDGKTGPQVVAKWLAGDTARRFVFLYSTSSTGWKEYTALQDGAYADRVRVCVLHGDHLSLPKKVGAKLFLDTDRWLDEKCVAP